MVLVGREAKIPLSGKVFSHKVKTDHWEAGSACTFWVLFEPDQGLFIGY